MIKKILTVILIISLCFTHTSCAPIIGLFNAVLMLPFQIIAMAFNLIPVALKYAPYALLFLVKSDAEADEIQAYAERNNVEHALEKIDVTDTLVCYRVNLNDVTAEERDELSSHIVSILNENQASKLFLASSNERSYGVDTIYSIWMYMNENGISVACDDNLAAYNSNQTDRKQYITIS